ncbi:MAG TPA: carboxypeptidase-like regulatory domain-containing protein, partial [Mucilaginibacter sp.]|nr:carboxypeptidase-like regulatory domain-containing protein [Mucilaginibacter sp.]
MLNLSYRDILLILLICFVPMFCLAQTNYDGQVIDKATEDPIAGVNVTLIKEKIGAQTNKRGYFELSSEKPLLNDTLQFSFIGYKTFKLSVSEYQSQMFIILEASNTQLKEVQIAKKRKLKEIVLGKFGWYDLKDFQGASYSHSTEVVKSRTALAKFFKAP